MRKKIVPREELLQRWRRIQEEEEEEEEGGGDNDDPDKRRRLHRLKEEWFADTFTFLISSPKETHIWCGSWDLMGPLLETFYNYYKDERDDSPLHLLWNRISKEMQHCFQCISQHHQAQEMYSIEYESSSIGPLLDVLRSLDEERVTQHLRAINSKLDAKEYDPLHDNADVVSLMYEILMFPVLLDDQSLITEFELFVQAIDNMHELALGGEQQFPGVYALLFFNRRVRTVGRRLARSMDKLRRATDLEPLQPLLSKFIGFLETEVLPLASNSSRPRVKLERLSIWLGFTSLFEFLEPPAFEEGILERYPIFFDIVLNHISGDSAEFSHAVSCLKELFKLLGCKLWLRSTLSPSVMRNTLLGQCFHTRNEKMHIDIFDLFPPFLQSLEALQDGEHEKQRRHFLYFLLHQVPFSSNFSILTRRMACKIALLIVHRGYKMEPPCPPFECAHMWGPSLVSSLKDFSLHSSLRQPAVDLIQTIIVSDAAALVTSLLNDCTTLSIDRSIAIDQNDNDCGLSLALDFQEKDNNCWSEFTAQSRITSEYKGWMCIPMIWIDVLVDLEPSVLPVSFYKAVFWARSRLVMVEPETSDEMELAVRSWLPSAAMEISTSFGWKVPMGCDDGGVGNESKNSVNVSTMHLPLTRTFNRLIAHFLIQTGVRELQKQWTWEPRMVESLILLLVDPNDNVRHFGKCILEHVSNTRGLACGLKFLCSNVSSLSAIFLGLRHALKVVQLDSVISKFHTLQHIFFVLCKLIKEDTSKPGFPGTLSDDSTFNKYSNQGGFLTQSVVGSSPVNVNGHSLNEELKSQENFRCLLSKTVWPSIQKCLVEGKAFLDHSPCQMTCVRILEILPVVFERLLPTFIKHSGYSENKEKTVFDLIWLHDLIDWGKSLLKVVVVYWKRAVTSLMNLLKGYCSSAAAPILRTIENLASCDSINIDRLTEQVSHLRVLLTRESSSNIEMATSEHKSSFSASLFHGRRYSTQDVQPVLVDDADVQVLNLTHTSDKGNVIFLSDDEDKNEISHVTSILSHIDTDNDPLGSKRIVPTDKSALQAAVTEKVVPGMDTSRDLLGAFQQQNVPDRLGLISEVSNFEKLRGKTIASMESKGEESKRKEVKTKSDVDDFFSSPCGIDLRNAFEDTVNSKTGNQAHNKMVSETRDSVLRELVKDTNDNPLDPAVKSAKIRQSGLVKLSVSGPKRQVIQLRTPYENRFGNMQRDAKVKRFKSPKLDVWYRPILEMDYFATVGLTSAKQDENRTVTKLKEVPICFESPGQYVDIFQPLVLEEFKAQLYSSFLESSSWEEMYYGSLSVLSVERIDDFHYVRFVHEDNNFSSSKSFVENDLVLLTKGTPQSTCHDVHMVGKVERRERDNNRRGSIILVRFYFLNGSQRLNQARRQLIERSKWHASRIMNMTPQLREFQALSAVEGIPILPTILEPINGSLRCHKSRDALSNLPRPLQQMLKSSFNESQLQAISGVIGLPNSKNDFELSLIQGPPGTGKTRTIVAIVSALFASLQGMNETKSSQNGHSKQFSTPAINTRTKISHSVAIARAWQDAALASQLNEDAEKNKRSMVGSVRRRVLICAQSNAAVDELVSRITSEGLYGSDGKMYKPYLVRVGNTKTVHQNSMPFFVDTLVDHRLAEEKMHLIDAKNDLSGVSSIVLRSNLEKLVDRIRFYEAKRADLRDGYLDKNLLENELQKRDDTKEKSDAEVESKLQKLYEQKKQIYRDLSAAQARERKASEELKSLKHKLRKVILKEAEIVVTTLSGCGGDLFGVCSESMSSHKFVNPSEHALFDAIVIDEAAQALEPATLIPLQLLKSKGTQCIMVGDPKQLPATVLSSVASKFLYECSMFERLQRAGHPVAMLTKQYRMHPDICRFPSLHFYDGKLLNGGIMSSKVASFHETECLGPYVFYDVIDGHELRGKNSGALSVYNEHEVEAAVELLKLFKKRYPSEFIAGRIGIITPYKSQLSLLRSCFSIAFGSSVTADMEFNTVDGFQGREVDILILSTVRAANSGSTVSRSNFSSIGFVADVRRMNVALTRAKLSLWILGNARTLQSNDNWAALVEDAQERNLIISVKRPYRSSFKTCGGDNGTPENSDNLSGKTKDTENLRDTMTKNEHKMQTALPRNANRISSSAQRNNLVVGGADTLLVKRKDACGGRRRAGDEQGLPERIDFPSAGSSHEKKLSRNAKFTVLGGHVADDGSRGSESSKEKPDSSNFHKGVRKEKCKNSENISDYSKQERSEGHKRSKANERKGSMKHLEHSRSQRNLEVSTSLAEGNQEVMEVKDGRTANHLGASEDLINKRKQQRDAVDAILNSSLISSKKSEPAIKSVAAKRPTSPTSSISRHIRPPKRRNG